MSCIACEVISADTGWMVRSGAVPRGPYAALDIALRIAYVEAASFRWNGKPARISVRRENGDVIAEYCLCSKAKFVA
jgi:hypothetical protein